MKKFLFLTALLFATSGCSLYQIEAESTSFDYYPSKASPNEIVYLEAVDKAYDVIGKVTVNAERNQKRKDVLDKLKYEASVLGGDAITNIKTNGGTGKWAQIKPKELFGNGNIRTNFIADVIVFKDSSSGKAAVK